MSKIVLKRICLAVILAFNFLFVNAQAATDSSATIDGTMRSHDKIYVVMAVCIVILVAFFLYLIRIDIKLSKKEKISY
ncbi:MAG: CcmD family protein [Ginsengibacter sp.]